MLMLYMSVILITICFIMMMINNIISKKSFIDREKSSPFECGFDPKSSPRLPFSIHFFLIAVIFLVFDVEITILLPMIYTMKISNITSFMIVFSMFTMILLLGVYHEWKQGALSWTN